MTEQQAVTRPLPAWVFRAVLCAQLSGLLALALANYCDRHSPAELATVIEAAGIFGISMMVSNPIFAMGLLLVTHSNLKQATVLGGLLLAILIADMIALLPLIQ